MIRIGPHHVEPRRLGLTPREAARVLGVGERQVRSMVRSGRFRNVSAQRRQRLDALEVASAVASDAAALEILAALVAGRIPRPGTPPTDARPKAGPDDEKKHSFE